MNAEKLDDAVLVQMYRNGCNESLEILVHRYYKDIKRYIFNLVRDSFIAEDLTQDVFIKVIVSIKNERYSEDNKFSSWLFRLAHNLVFDSFRKNKRKSSEVSLSSPLVNGKGDDIYIQIPNGMKNAEEEILKKEMSYDLLDLVNNLSKEQQEVVLLRHFQDFSFKEIADFTNVSINTAVGRMRYALLNIKGQIENIQEKGRSVL